MSNWINLLEVVYPIGSIYESTKSTSPSQLIGGTWKQITEKFLFAAGENYVCGQTGGEEEHTLSIEEMPRHFHKASNKNFAITANSTATAPSWGASYRKTSAGNTDYEGGNLTTTCPLLCHLYLGESFLVSKEVLSNDL